MKDVIMEILNIIKNNSAEIFGLLAIFLVLTVGSANIRKKK